MSGHDLWYALSWVFFTMIMGGWGLIAFRPVVGGDLNPLGLLMVIAGATGDLVYDASHHRIIYATLDAGYLACVIWLWWTRGGGDRMRKRLNRLKRRLIVRQPVPQGA